jgi:hypothetical protein
MNLGIIGSRSFNNYNLLKEEVNNFLKKEMVDCIVSGGARGADTLAEKYAKECNIPTLIIRPEWDKYGKKAGYLRNIEIVKNSEVIIAFWDGVSSGTKMSIDLAKKANKIIKIIRDNS